MLYVGASSPWEMRLICRAEVTQPHYDASKGVTCAFGFLSPWGVGEGGQESAIAMLIWLNVTAIRWSTSHRQKYEKKIEGRAMPLKREC